ncbi:MAG: pyridoxamine 5'-phosphate oxidase family protein [Halioglobus sp.]
MSDLASIDDYWATRFAEQRVVCLATLNEDGSLYTSTAWYLYENDTFYFAVQSDSRIADNVSARSKLAFTLYIGAHGAEEELTVSGRGKIIEGDKAQAINLRLHQRYFTDEALADPQVGPVLAIGNDQTVKVSVEAIRVWRLAELDQFFGGKLSSTDYLRKLSYR